MSDDRGEIASTLIIFTLVITMFFASVHALYIFHGSHVVSAAAQDALARAQLEGSTFAEAEQLGESRLGLFSALEGDVVVNPLRNDQIEVIATARVDTPFLNLGRNLTTRVQGPAERFYEQRERE